MTTPQVAIVGSGLAGLLIAQGLRKNGIPAVVFERESAIDTRGRDWTLMLHWGLEVLPKILSQNVLDHFSEAFCDPFYSEDRPPSMPCFNGVTGETMFFIPSTGARLISRQRFRKVLSRNLDIQFGKQLALVEEVGREGVRLYFQDGSEYHADIVIGADGPNSIIRKHLVGEERAAAKTTPWVISLASFTFDNAVKAMYARQAHPVWHMGYGPQGICALAVQHAGAENDPEAWEFTYLKLWHGTVNGSVQGEAALKKFREKSLGFCEPYGSAAKWIPEGSDCHIDQLRYWVPEQWDSAGGRLTLAGDAAHAILPFRGQGLNHCVDDSLHLVDTLVQIRDGGDQVELMAEYDQEVYERGKAAVLASLEEGKKKMEFDLLMTSMTAQQGFAKETPKI